MPNEKPLTPTPNQAAPPAAAAPVAPTPALPATKKSWRRWVWIGIILIVIVALVGIFIYLRYKTKKTSSTTTTSTTVAIASWKTYEDNSLGFSVKYPPTWQVLAPTSISSAKFVVLTIRESSTAAAAPNALTDGIILTKVNQLKSTGTLDGNTALLLKYIGQNSLKAWQAVPISGGKGYYNSILKSAIKKGGTAPVAYLVSKNSIFMLKYDVESTRPATDIVKLFNQTISTFVFTP